MKSTALFEAIEGKGMDIVNFFEKVEGTWFSQRTTHFPPGRPSQTGQTTLNITRLADDDSRIAALCQQFAADANQIAFALQTHQEAQTSTYGAATAMPQRITVLVAMQANGGETGQFFSQTEQEAAVTGQYCLEDEVLTLTIATETLNSEERIWFMNPNLRMRTSLLKRADGFQMASFCSEIRRLSPSQ